MYAVCSRFQTYLESKEVENDMRQILVKYKASVDRLIQNKKIFVLMYKGLSVYHNKRFDLLGNKTSSYLRQRWI